ncbi:MAG: endonuclease/exonuclease/phosphatase family protein [Myxococcota bacterium]
MEEEPQTPAPPSAEGEATPPPRPRRRRKTRLRVKRRDGGVVGLVLTGMGVATVIVLAGVTVLGRQLSAPPAFLAAAVAMLPYLYLTTALVVFALWSVFPDRRALPAALAAVIALGAVLWGPSWPARGVTAEGETVRVMSWNLRRLWGGPDDHGDPFACAVEVIAQSEADVLTLLEVSSDDVQRLERALGMDCTQHAYLSTSGSKQGGLAACARGDWSVRTGQAQRFVDDQDWYYVFSEVEHNGVLFNLLAVHLYPYEYVAKKLRSGVRDLASGKAEPLQELGEQGSAIVRGQSDQAAALLDRVARFEDPTVVAGDFNSTRDASLHAHLREHLVDGWEQGGEGFGGTVALFDWLPLRIDYVYASPDLPVVKAELPDAGCSDHRPVLVELDVPN